MAHGTPRAIAALGLVIVAGGAVLAATAVYALWPSKKSEAGVRPLPVVTAGGGGVLVTGAF